MNPIYHHTKCLIFNIQKFSVNDGPGIRTTVFIKGCPLHCGWCANPESQSHRVQMAWDTAKCIRCGRCTTSCPQNAISLTDSLDGDEARKQSIIIDHAKCSGCKTCVMSCPAKALSTEGEWKDADEVFKICMQDVDFYEESGGGVTLSGGEVLSSPDFAEALMLKLREERIHIALETTGFASPEIFDRITRLADLLLFDMKHWDEAMHIKGTGVSNLEILENMKRAIANGIEVLPRIPVIPKFNDSIEDAVGFSGRLKDVDATRVQLLPFHQFGENKYQLLGRSYAYSAVNALHPEDLEAYRDVFIKNDIDAFF